MTAHDEPVGDPADDAGDVGTETVDGASDDGTVLGEAVGHGDDEHGRAAKPSVPEGKFVHLEGRGNVLVRDFGGKPGAPVVILLHGWTASADLNWYRCYEALGEHYRVIAFDHRGHAAGLRTKTAFRLEDCADDAADIATALGVDRFIPVGYSMGGPIAQLVWQRHPDRVDGLVLCATAPFFSSRRPERLSFLGITGLATIAKYTPEQTREWLTDQIYLQRKTEQWEPWAVEEASSHDWRTVLQAGTAIGRFSSSEWIGDVDVPTSVLITMTDRVIPLARQVKLFEMIPGAEAFRVDGDHDAVVALARRFVPTLLRAIDSVVSRAATAGELGTQPVGDQQAATS